MSVTLTTVCSCVIRPAPGELDWEEKLVSVLRDFFWEGEATKVQRLSPASMRHRPWARARAAHHTRRRHFAVHCCRRSRF